MFTGLIEEIGVVKGVIPSGEGRDITIAGPMAAGDTRRGDSIAINGACQTVTALGAGGFTVFASPVTLDITTLGSLAPGSRVNLERAMAAGGRFGGHLVQGHIDGTGRIASIVRDARGMRVSVSLAQEFLRYMVPKGSVAVDGISLTVVTVVSGSFDLYLIPETMQNTIATEWRTGDRVNIEVDILAKYVEQLLRGNGDAAHNGGDESIMKKLSEGGFM